MRRKALVKPVIRHFLKATRKYRFFASLSLGAIFLVHVVEVVTPLFYKRLFDTLAMPEDASVVVPLLMTILITIVALHTIGWGLGRIGLYASIQVVGGVMSDLMERAFVYLMRHSYSFFTGSFTGSLVRKVSRLPRSYEQVFDRISYNIIPLIVLATGSLIVLSYRNAYLGAALLIWILLFLAVQFFLIRWKQKYLVARAEKDSEVTGALADSVSNETNVKLFSGNAHEHSLFRKVLKELEGLRVFTWNIDWWIDFVQGALMIAIEFVLIWGAIELWSEGVLTIGDFALIQAYLISLFQALWNFGNVLRQLYEAFAEATEMVEILETPYEVEDLLGAGALCVTGGAITFRSVHFSFRKTRTVLDNFSLEIKGAERVALVGPSGAGKSTIVKLLFRLYDIDSGVIAIDGTDIKTVTQDSLRSAIALVPQDPILFHRTLMENIRYGRRDATDEEVIEAAKQAHCHEFISEFPEGYETFVGERGVKLSGGERQRVAIARAILKDAPILVLDEATSSLDSESEALIQDALETLMRGKTVIVIAHRLSTIQKMDRIVVMESGKVITMGTHAELMKKPGLYQKLWAIQAGGFLPDQEKRAERFEEDL